MTRPVLPSRHANPHLKQINDGPLPPVKYQILNCQGKDILVGRMKISTPTPSGHAFILRRFDTGAISLTTMFRAAFPSATDQEEKRETTWVKDNYNLAGNNGSSKDVNIIRLAGTWISPDVAIELGTAYSLTNIMTAVVQATPDPHATYRRSGKPTSGGSPKVDDSPMPPSKTLPSPSPTVTSPTPSKRRKESSPISAETCLPTPPRRSARTKSPLPKPPSTRATRKPPSKTTRKEKLVTPEGSDDIAADDLDGMDSVAGEDLHAEDIVEQKKIIAGLKAQREVFKKEAGEGPAKAKRARNDDEAMQFEFKEPEVGERTIASNRKVSAFRLEPRTKSAAWGIAAFAVGLGAVSFIPNFL